MRTVIALGLTFLFPGLVAAGGDPEKTLRDYLAKSDVVVVGEFTTEPAKDWANEWSRIDTADFKIAEVVKWDAPGAAKPGDTIKVFVALAADESLSEFKKGGKCLLFLECYDQDPTPSYVTADLWFGVQPPRPGLVKALARVAAEQKKTPLTVPAAKDIEHFYPDPIPAHFNIFKDFKVDKDAIARVLRDYKVIPKQDWKHGYSHVDGGDRTGAIVLKDGTKVKYMVRPGGLATLTFIDGRKLYLAEPEK